MLYYLCIIVSINLIGECRAVLLSQLCERNCYIIGCSEQSDTGDFLITKQTLRKKTGPAKPVFF